MDAELKRKWVDALRSGEYAQTMHTLRDINGYCCLGVLANIIDSAAWKKSEYASTGVKDWVYKDTQFEMYLDDSSLIDFTGLNFKAQQILMGMNDAGKSFPEIADWIEENL